MTTMLEIIGCVLRIITRNGGGMGGGIGIGEVVGGEVEGDARGCRGLWMRREDWVGGFWGHRRRRRGIGRRIGRGRGIGVVMDG